MQVNGVVNSEGYVQIYSTDNSPLRLVDDISYHASDHLIITWKEFHVKIHENQQKYIQLFWHVISILRTDRNAVLSNLAGITDKQLHPRIIAINTIFQQALTSYRNDYLSALQTDYEGWRYEKWKAYVSSDFYFPHPWDKPIFNTFARAYNHVNPVLQKQSHVDQREGSHARCLWMSAIGVQEKTRKAADYQQITHEVAVIANEIAAMQNGPLNVIRLLKFRKFLWQFEKMREYEYPDLNIQINGQTIPQYIASLGLPN